MKMYEVSTLMDFLRFCAPFDEDIQIVGSSGNVVSLGYDIDNEGYGMIVVKEGTQEK